MAFLTVLNLLLAAALLPLAGGLLLRGWGRRLGRHGRAAGAVGVAIAVASFGLSLAALVRWVGQDGFQETNYVEAFTCRWVPVPASAPLAAPSSAPEHVVPSATADAAASGGVAGALAEGLAVGCMIDSLTIGMFLVVTLLNVLVHLFALGSADGQDDRGRFFAWLAWLNFALLGLLLSNSLVQVVVFWEGTSLAAFFLIRLTVSDRAAGPPASLRMYLMNAVGTAALVLGIGLLVLHTHSTAALTLCDDRGDSVLAASVRRTLNAPASEFLFSAAAGGYLHLHWLTWAGICFVVAALARMAQFPFFSWLHHVAEAPAAAVAMVTLAASTAGVFLLARLYPILTLDARLFLALVGGVTLAAGVGVALVQSDLRQILAWLTVSQGGYVLLFLGAGGYEAGILHLFTQGFLRTALFLAAGTVLRGLGTADIRQMGGLWKRFPITAFASLLAVLAVAGAPWLSGAYATNLGLACVYDYAHTLQAAHGRYFQHFLFYLPAAFTYVTALAIGRWWWLTFAGINRAPKLYDAAHEAVFLTLPVILLAAFYAGRLYDFAGLLPLIGKSVPAVLRTQGGPVLTWLGSAQAQVVVLRDTGLAFLGLGIAVFIYLNGMGFAARLRRLPFLNGVEFWLRERFFFDEFTESALLPALRLAVRLVAAIEWLALAILRLCGRLLALLAYAAERLNAPSTTTDPASSPPPGESDDPTSADGPDP
jgi:NADH-quinone oxidoreductase subunit L